MNKLSSKVIMIIEVDPQVAHWCRTLLESVGHDVVIATGPRQGLALLERLVVDLVLVDLQMGGDGPETDHHPGLDGFQVVEQARRRYPDIAFVVMADRGAIETAIQALQIGADGLLLRKLPGEQDQANGFGRVSDSGDLVGGNLVHTVSQALVESEKRRDAARLHAIRPLIQITEQFFSERNLEVLLPLILQVFSDQLRCSHAGYYLPTHGEHSGLHPVPRPVPWRDVTYANQRARGDEADGDYDATSPADGAPARRSFEMTLGLGEAISQKWMPQVGEVLSQAFNWHSIVWVRPEDIDAFDGLRQAMDALHIGTLMCGAVFRGARQEDDAGQSKDRTVRDTVAGGVVVVMRGVDEPAFTQGEHETFVILCRQAAGALENAILDAELRDTIQQLRDSQRALIQAEKMAAIGRISASIAHEVNNPLQAMQNCLYLAGREDLPREKREAYLQLARQELTRLMNISGQMLDYYRPSAITREIVTLENLLEGVLILVEKELEQQEVAVHVHLADGLPPVFVVRNQIQQVFLNIILNAIEAMAAEDGTADNTPRRIEIKGQVGESGGGREAGAPGRGGTVEVTFMDSGPGIAPDKRENIFEPFNSSKESGMGLGLSISYNILEAHGGKLEVVDTGQKGACFKVVLPA